MLVEPTRGLRQGHAPQRLFRRGAECAAGRGHPGGRRLRHRAARSKDQCFIVDSPGLTTFVPGAISDRASTRRALDRRPPPPLTASRPVASSRRSRPRRSEAERQRPAAAGLRGQRGLPGPVGHDRSRRVYAATTAETAASLGRHLAGGARTVNVSLIVPHTLFEGRIRRLDLRLTKNFQLTQPGSPAGEPRRLQRPELQRHSVDQYTFGPNWLTPTPILDPRILQFSGQLTF